MRQKIGKICMVLGALLILAAAALLAYNKWDAARADKAAQQALGELEQTLTTTVEEKAKSETVVLQPELDPAQPMTETELDGWSYIGYLSIPSIGLDLPVMSEWSYAGLRSRPADTPAPPTRTTWWSAPITMQSTLAPSNGWPKGHRSILPIWTACGGAMRSPTWRTCSLPRSKK